MAISERIKEIRKIYGLSQAAFGKRIGLTQTGIAAYETGRSAPSDAAILNICREYSINEQWLRTGEGIIKVSQDRKIEIMDFVDRALSAPESIQYKLLSVLAHLTMDDWNRVSEIIHQLSEEQKNH